LSIVNIIIITIIELIMCIIIIIIIVTIGKMGIGRILNGEISTGDQVAYGKPDEPVKKGDNDD
jgi:predicted membrane GTPase involved in stress response